MAPKHARDLFSAAYDGALDVNDAQRFRAHLDSCAECAAEYEQFRAGIDAVRAVPPARMPLPVHLPTDAPVAEQTLRSRLPRMPRFRFVPGLATAAAAAAAAVIVVVALNNHGGSNALSTGNGSFGGAGAQNAPATVTSCPATLASPVSATAVAGYQHVVRATASGRPGQELVLATQGATVAAGSQVLVYAELTVPQASVAAPPGAGNGASAGSVASASSSPAHAAAVLPCLQVSSRPTKVVFAPLQRATNLQAAPGAAQQPASGALSTGPSAPIQAFTVPAGTPSGTVIDVTAVIPANYPASGDPPFTLGLQITVR
jgi:Putative zinc-finger